MERNLKLISIIIIVLIVLVAIIGSILFFATDLLKSDEILFKKYLAQDIQNIAEVFDFKNEEMYLDYIKENDYTENTDIDLSYIENENDQEEIYNIKTESINNTTDKSYYKNIKINYGAEELSNIELLRQNEIYGFRLSDLVQQFVSIENATMYYVVTNLGYNGNYFQEKMNIDELTFKELFDFSEEEIQKMKENYFNVIFSDINSKSYSSKNKALITLYNQDSITAKQYTLTLSKTDLDKIYKKVLNQAINDDIILSKLEKIDNEIIKIGFNEPQGESLKEKYISKLTEKYNSIEYLGQNEEMITFNVFQSKGKTYRVSMKTDINEYIIDLNTKNGTELSYKTVQLTQEGEDIFVYAFGKNADDSRHFIYEDNNQKLDLKVSLSNHENSITSTGELLYKSNDISQIKVNLNTNMDFSEKKDIPIRFDKNIVLNNYESDVIDSVFSNLRERIIKRLEEKQSIINTKMLNKITLWIDKKEEERISEEHNASELKKQRFNNKFILYEGENIEIETIKKLLDLAGNNMSDYKIIDNKQIKIMVESGVKNQEKADQIMTILSSNKYNYNVNMEYNEEGYINAIIISIYKK